MERRGMAIENLPPLPTVRRAQPLAVCLLLLLPACGTEAPPTLAGDDERATRARTEGSAAEQDAFWRALETHCGNAYRGRVDDATSYYESAREGAAVMHFMECSEDRIHIPFHLGDNRSRNWILTRVDGTIRLKHDHRNPDGTEEEISQYGGDAPVPGLATRQIFPADEHTARILPERADNFWFFDLVDEETLHYGVHWPKHGHSVRFEFDLSTPVEAPPRPWGWDGEEGF
jgi:hypothetical protein